MQVQLGRIIFPFLHRPSNCWNSNSEIWHYSGQKLLETIRRVPKLAKLELQRLKGLAGYVEKSNLRKVKNEQLIENSKLKRLLYKSRLVITT